MNIPWASLTLALLAAQAGTARAATMRASPQPEYAPFVAASHTEISVPRSLCSIRNSEDSPAEFGVLRDEFHVFKALKARSPFRLPRLKAGTRVPQEVSRRARTSLFELVLLPRSPPFRLSRELVA